jgi:hypothetical protein
VIQVGLVAMFCFIFIVFFAQNIVSDSASCGYSANPPQVMLAIGYHLCGWAWCVQVFFRATATDRSQGHFPGQRCVVCQ